MEKLDLERANLLHNMTSRGIFVTKQSRGDIHTTLCYLSTRVRMPDLDDWKKLQRMMKYLENTAHLVGTLHVDDKSVLRWSVDTAHAVHPDMKGHTGGCLTLGKGILQNASRKQKINTCSSTETELIGVYDMLPNILWTRLFLKAQGYKSTETIIDQDNKSSILLENHGKFSSSKRNKQINIWYFYITDKIKNKEVKVRY